MPRVIPEYRQLCDRLWAALSERDDAGTDHWPKFRQLFEYLREHRRTACSERDYGKLRQYGTGPVALVDGMMAYLVENRGRWMADFARRQGYDAELTAGGCLDEFTVSFTREQATTDWRFLDGWRSIQGLAVTSLLASEDQMVLTRPADVEELVKWFMKDVGYEFAQDQGLLADSLSETECLALAEQHLQRTLPRFQQRLLDYWRAAPWSVVQATSAGRRVGGSAIIPLRTEIYQRLRDGDITDLDIRGDHLTVPSRNLVAFQITKTRNPKVGNLVGWDTSRCLGTILYQGARLSWDPVPRHEPAPIRLLSIGGSRAVDERLERHGYQRVGRLKGFSVALYEMIVPAPEVATRLPRSSSQAYASLFAMLHETIRRRQFG